MSRFSFRPQDSVFDGKQYGFLVNFYFTNFQKVLTNKIFPRTSLAKVVEFRTPQVQLTCINMCSRERDAIIENSSSWAVQICYLPGDDRNQFGQKLRHQLPVRTVAVLDFRHSAKRSFCGKINFSVTQFFAKCRLFKNVAITRCSP